MKHSSLALLAPVLALMAGCAGQPISAIPRPSDTNRGEVVIYRESSFIAGGVSLTVGVGKDAIASIDNTELVRVLLVPGEHDVFVRARTAEPTKVHISLAHNSRICLRTSASPDTLAKVFVPITLIATGYHFYLNKVSCPADAELERYKSIAVNYAQSRVTED